MKKTVYLVIIVIALSGAAIMAYMAFFAEPKQAPADGATGEVVSADPGVNSHKVLPYGTDLDFQKLKSYNKTKTVYPYPVVGKDEIGKPLGKILGDE